MADKDLEVDKHGAITARVSATDNPINNASVSFDRKSTRLTLSGTTGVSGSLNVGQSQIIGSAGVETSLAANLFSSSSNSRQYHDSSTDRVRPGAVGVFEAQDILHEVVDKTGGHLGRYKVSEALDLLNRHPNIARESSREHIGNVVNKLESVNYTPSSGVAQTQQDIAAAYENFKQSNPTLDPKVDYAIGKVYDATQSPSLRQPHTLADPIMDTRLSDINKAAERAHDFITAKGGPEAIGNLVASANGALTSAGQRSLPDTAAADIQGVIARVDNAASHITSEYHKMPTAEQIISARDTVDKLVKYDPRAEATGFVALGVLNPVANAALVAKETVSVGIGNIDKAPSEHAKIHPAIITSLRGEVGIAGDRFSPETDRKLNRAISKTETQMGGYGFVEQEKMRWMNMDGSRKSTNVGAGFTLNQPAGGGTTSTVSIEAFKGTITDISPGDTLKVKNNGIKVTGGVNF
jgi:hypothetical protein